MRALLEDMKSGRVATHDVPAPELRREASSYGQLFQRSVPEQKKFQLESGRKSLFGKALARPDLVKQVLQYAQSNGIESRPSESTGPPGDALHPGLFLFRVCARGG